jgi:MFS family permease
MADTAAVRISKLRSSMAIAALVVAGEAIFFLPYLITRVFRPTFLEVFGVTNFELGLAFSAYGLVAMICYAIGGPIADRFPARTLMTVALAATAAGGLYMATVPELRGLTLLYAFWGLTSILLFWAALIRATREWGGEARLGSAFGLLDGGRGLFAALVGAAAYALFAALLPDVEGAAPGQRREALRQVILLFTGAVVAVAVLVWIVLPSGPQSKADRGAKFTLRSAVRVAAMPTLWLQALVIVCAYVGYKAIDDVSLYAREVMGMDELRAAGVGAAVLWIRPISCVAAGWLADRGSVTAMSAASFALVLLGSSALASGVLQATPLALFMFVIAASASGIYALRGLYFAIMGEARIPLSYTGTAVGIVSTIGYTPDVFSGPLMGYLLDRSPGPSGHYHWFGVVAAFALLGLLATLALRKLTAR